MLAVITLILIQSWPLTNHISVGSGLQKYPDPQVCIHFLLLPWYLNILDGNSDVVAHAKRKMDLLGEKNVIRDSSLSNQMP